MDNKEYLEFVAILEDTRTRTGSHGCRPVRAVAQSLTRQSPVTKPSA